jgi:hypothetical protein
MSEDIFEERPVVSDYANIKDAFNPTALENKPGYKLLDGVVATPNYFKNTPKIKSPNQASMYDPYGDWSSATTARKGWRLPEPTEADDPAERGSAYMGQFFDFDDMLRDELLVPGKTGVSVDVASLLSDSVGKYRIQALRNAVNIPQKPISQREKMLRKAYAQYMRADKKPMYIGEFLRSDIANEQRDRIKSRFSISTALGPSVIENWHPYARPIVTADKNISPESDLKEQGLPDYLGSDAFSKEQKKELLTDAVLGRARVQYKPHAELSYGSMGGASPRIKAPTSKYVAMKPANSESAADTLYGADYSPNALGGKEKYLLNDNSYQSLAHEGMHAMTAAQMYDDKKTNAMLGLPTADQYNSAGYARYSLGEATRAMHTLKSALARHLIQKGQSAQDVVNNVQNPNYVLKFMRGVYDNVGDPKLPYTEADTASYHYPGTMARDNNAVEVDRAVRGLQPYFHSLLYPRSKDEAHQRLLYPQNRNKGVDDKFPGGKFSSQERKEFFDLIWRQVNAGGNPRPNMA